jgi:hypothetical protein
VLGTLNGFFTSRTSYGGHPIPHGLDRSQDAAALMLPQQKEE